ncbi:FHA domain-containing protein [Streptomyces sp. NPDC054961]
MPDKIFRAQMLPPEMPSLADGLPVAPPGTIFVKAAAGGYAVPRRKFTLHFGRAVRDVHVLVGAGDAHVSRLHGVFTCDGGQWWLRNEGRRPIQFPGEGMVLRGHELPMPAGYTPLTIETPHRKAHLIEVHVVGGPCPVPREDAQTPTDTEDVHDLKPVERLVVTVLAQQYLRREPYPTPVSWKQLAHDLNRVAPYRRWTDSVVDHVIADLRLRLSRGPDAVRGLLREEVGEPVGNTLNVNLIEALLKSATLIPDDLDALGEEL